MPEVKFFTPKEAAQMLPLVKRIVADILAIGKHIRRQEDAEQLDELFAELEALGCSYKDWSFSEGLVDFPAMIHGKEVLLCWKSDEPEIRYYHDLESGFAGRLPIPEEGFL